MRAFCQVVHLDRTPDTVIVDLVVLEPSEPVRDDLVAGTPLTMAFVATMADEMHDLETTMRRWERGCTVLDLEVDRLPLGLRYSFASDVQQLILNVEDSG
jgi:hypothetical protein